MIHSFSLRLSLAAALLTPFLSQAQTGCDNISLPDTVEHCTNDPLLLVPEVQPCLSAFSVELDGGNDFVSWNTGAGHLLADAQGDITWSSWWKMDTNPNNDLQFMWEEGDANTGWNLYTENGMLFCGWWQEGDTSMWSVSVLPIGTFDDWDHVAVVGDTAAMTFSVFLNQTLIGSTSGYHGLSEHGSTATLGAGGTSLLHTGQVVNTGGGGGGGGGGTPYEWEGWVDEVGYWSTALDAEALAVAADCPLHVAEGLEAAWLMEPGEEYEALDFSGNGWTGNLQGGELVNEAPDAWPNTYAWSNGDTTPGLSVTLGNGGGDLPTGWIYLTVTLTDGTVCMDSTYAIDWNPNVVATVTSPSCFGGSNGSIVATLDGGTAPYTVEISGGADPAALEAGQYQVVVTDANGCDDGSNITVNDPEGMFYSFTTTTDDCTDANLGSAFLDTLISPNGDVTVDWGGLELDALAGGSYSVVATDPAGCSQNLDFYVDTDLSNCPTCDGFDLLPDSIWDCFQGPALVTANTVECPNFFGLELDGSNDRLEIGAPQGGGPGGGQPGNPLFGDEVVAMTLSIEFENVDLNNKQVLYKEGDQNAGLVLYLDDDSLRAGWWDDNTVNAEGLWVAVGGLTSGQWQRAGWSCDAANGTMWVGLEGGDMATVNFTDTLGEHEAGGYIGATQTVRFHDGISFSGGGGGGWNHEFEGMMDRFAMWDAAMDFATWEAATFCPEATMAEALFAFHSFESDANDVSIDQGTGLINGEYGSGANHAELGVDTEETYIWSNGDTTPYSFLTGSGAGTQYSLFYSSADIAGCVDTLVVVDWNPQAFVVNVTPPSCVNTNDGSVELALDGGTAPYTWSVFGEPSADSLSVGNYFATVSDANGCSDNTQFSLDVQLLWDVTFSVDPLLCPTDTTSTATAVPAGESGPWTYLWDDGSMDAMSGELDLGLHSVEVTDATGCSETFDVLVEPGDDMLTVSIAAFPPPCVGEVNGMAEATVSGGVSPYTLDWLGNDPMDLLPGAYTVGVTDDAGCMIEADFVVADSAVLELVVTVTDVTCAGDTDGAITVESVENNGTLTIDWGGAGEEGVGVAAGTYALNVVDALGCTATAEATVNSPTPLPAGTLTGPTVVETGVGSLYSYTGSGQAGTSVIWTVSGGMLITSDNTQAVIFWEDLDGAFICAQEVDANGCAGELACLNDLTVNGVEEAAALAVDLFPQPAAQTVTLTWNISGQMNTTVYNLAGQTLSTSTHQGGQATLDLASLPNGMYVVECQHDQGIQRLPLVVKR